ncbi:MAG: LacI family DNA-binding transcriptional regulator [Leptothrix sp. (in: b-proteobacteria)]
MSRPTIRDLAAAAGVSVATVNRILAGSDRVRGDTIDRVVQAAQRVGFYGLGALQHRAAQASVNFRLGVVIQSPHRPFSTALAQVFADAAAARPDEPIRVRVEQLEDLSPECVAERMREVGRDCDALAVLAAEHPIVAEAIDALAADGVPVVAIISPLSARANVGYVGLDSWKVGRTAAWAFHHLSRRGGELAILVGTHRYRCHDLYESGFRSYFREFATELNLLESRATFESDANARELTEKLLRDQPGLAGVYVSGGGISGAMAALREMDHQRTVLLIGHDLMSTTKAGLLDGTLKLVISHPFQQIATEALAACRRARSGGPDAGSQRVYVPFSLYTRENI